MVNEISGTECLILARGALDSLVLMAEELGAACGSALCCDIKGDSVEIMGGETVYLISWHGPTEQIWVASPKSGSVRFAYDTGKSLWLDKKIGRELFAFVKQEICEIFCLGQ